MVIFKITFFEKFFQKFYRSVKQIGFRSGPTFCKMSGLIWIQTVCRGYQQAPLVGKVNCKCEMKMNCKKIASKYTVNSEIFVRVYFRETSHMRSFVKIKASRNGEITLSFTDICKSCLSREFLMSQICLLTLFTKIKFSRKFPNLQYFSKLRLGFFFFLNRLKILDLSYKGKCPVKS